MPAYRPTGSLPRQGPLLPIVSRHKAKKDVQGRDQKNRINDALMEASEGGGIRS